MYANVDNNAYGNQRRVNNRMFVVRHKSYYDCLRLRSIEANVAAHKFLQCTMNVFNKKWES